MILVVDASVAMKWFVEEVGRADALAILRCNAEFANVLWKTCRKSEVSTPQAAQAISSVDQFVNQVVKCADLLERAFRWAIKLDHSIYDCLYLACAEAYGSKFISADTQFVRKLQGNRLDYMVMSLAQASVLLEESSAQVKISDSDVERILELHRWFEETLINVRDRVEETSGTLAFVKSTNLKPAFDSPAYSRLMGALKTLSTDDLCDLVALAWLGRGYDGDNWDHVRQQSRAMLGGEPSEHFRYVASLLGYVQSGLDKIEAQ